MGWEDSEARRCAVERLLAEADFNPGLHPHDRRGRFMRTWHRPKMPDYAQGGHPFASRYKPHIDVLRALDDATIKQLATEHNAAYPEAAAEIAQGHGIVKVSIKPDKYGKTAEVVFAPQVVLADGGTASAAEPMIFPIAHGGVNRPFLKQVKGHFRGMQVPVHVESVTGYSRDTEVIPPTIRSQSLSRQVATGQADSPQPVIPGLDPQSRADAVLKRLEPLRTMRTYGEGYDRTVATHANDAQRMALAGRVDEAEHWATHAEKAAAHVRERAAERAARGTEAWSSTAWQRQPRIREGVMELDRDEAVAYYGRAMERLAEHGWRPQQAHTIALEAGRTRYGSEFSTLVLSEGLFTRLGHAVGGGATHYDKSKHPHGRGGRFAETPDAPKPVRHEAPEPEAALPSEHGLANMTPRAKSLVNAVALHYKAFGGSDSEMRFRFQSGNLHPQDLRRMREQAMRARDERSKSGDAAGEKAARDTLSAIRVVERELGLSAQTAQQEKPVSSEELLRRVRNRPVERSIVDPYGHYSYQTG
jgi:hypothetical protein